MKLGINTNGPSSLKLSPFAIAHENAGKLLELSALATWPSERNKGHATALLEEVCKQADESGTLLVLQPDGETLEKWYEKFGFARIQDKPVMMCRDPQRMVYDIETDQTVKVGGH